MSAEYETRDHYVSFHMQVFTSRTHLFFQVSKIIGTCDGQVFFAVIKLIIYNSNKWRKKGSYHDLKHTNSSVDQGGGNVMTWACMASSGTGSFIFIDYVTHDGSSRINSEVYSNILFANLKRDGTTLNERSLIMQEDNDPKHTAKTTKVFIRVRKRKVLEWPSQSADLNPIEHAFYLLKRKLKGETPQNKQQLKEAAAKAWKSITKEESKGLVMSLGRRVVAVIQLKLKNNSL